MAKDTAEERRRQGRQGQEVQAARERKNVPFGLVFIQATFNNTIVTITGPAGQHAQSWKSLGLTRLPRLAQGHPVSPRMQAAVNAANAARDHGLRSVDVRVYRVPAPAVRAPSALSLRRGSRCAPSATLRRCRTTAAVRQKDAPLG